MDQEIPPPGDIPISLTTRLKNNTRVAESNFEANDAIGLYIMVQPATIEKTRYIDNMKFTYSPSSDFSPTETIFYPEGNSSRSTFIAYYPYQKNAINKGESGIEVIVETDQSNQKAISDSDFLVAETPDVAASEKPVELVFSHKLFQLNIQLKPHSGYTLDMLLDANPTVKIKNVYTKAVYDFNNDTFTNPSHKTDIIPYGTWEIKNDMLCGKSALIIPQTVPQSHVLIELDIQDRLFECELEEGHTLTSGMAESNTITLVSSDDAAKSTISTSIDEWKTQQKEINAKEKSSVIRIPDLNFTASPVQKVMHRERQVAEICLEYLCADEIARQAITIYPMKEGKADLTNGLVLRLVDETDDRHGGEISWNTSDNSLVYTAGHSSPIEYIYITENDEIKTIRPVNAVQLHTEPETYADTRGNETVEYPIVKIATQYWLCANLRATKYTDGISIEKGETTVNNTTAQYYIHANAYIFYNMSAVQNKSLIAEGWRIASETDFNHLITYIRNNAAVLKNGDSWKKGTLPFTNLTGFNAVAADYFDKTYALKNQYAAYWSVNDITDVADKMVRIYIGSNEIEISDATPDMALTIKCIRD